MLFMLALSILAFYYENMRFTYNLGIFRQVLTLLSFTKMKYIIFFWLGTFVKKNFASFIRFTDNQYVIAICLCIFFVLAIHAKPIYLSNNELRLLSFLLSGISGIIIVFTFFRKNEVYISRKIIIGKVLQFIGRRTLDIYLIHFFVLPYHIHQIGTWPTISYKLLDLVMFLILAFWIIAISLLISSIIRLSPFLGHYLLGAKRTNRSNLTDI